ncbi:HAD-IIA family hydrolase [Siminovitchia sp. 179-K 8D1 HS]|uniref:HAD-IIA family hydrolase n=1 Tax=Siminovitchia sp. 179-K 8D1 HS TaxID=3142385 RepID=UPI0039A12586
MKGFIFDLDGTIYVDNEMIEGAADAIHRLKSRGDRVIFLTNKSIARRIDYVEKLKSLGVDVTLDEVINSNFITAKYLKDNMEAGDTAYVIGEEPLFDELAEEEISITKDPQHASHVVIGWDRNFDYDKLNSAFQAWRNGAKIIATNPDRTCPIKEGEIPDCGAMIGAIEGATGETVTIVTGKPSPLMASYVLDKVLRLPAENVYMVGDRLETDIRMANEAGMNSVLVMTGITNSSMLERAADSPKYTLSSVKDIDQIE